MRWILYMGQLILAFIILTITYAMARWQASDLIDEIEWKVEHDKLKDGEVIISRLDELIYVAKKFPSTIFIMVLSLFYFVLVFALMYRYWKRNKNVA